MEVEDRKRYIFCDNHNRDSGTPDEFSFNFNDRQLFCDDDEIITMQVHDFLCQNSIDHGIYDTNNKFLWNDTLIEITPGKYTGESLAVHLTATINAQLLSRTKYVKTKYSYQEWSGLVDTAFSIPIGSKRGLGQQNIDFAAGKVTVTYIASQSKLRISVNLASITSAAATASQQIYVSDEGNPFYTLFLTTSHKGYLFNVEENLPQHQNNPIVAVGFDLQQLNGKSGVFLGLSTFDTDNLSRNNSELKHNSFSLFQTSFANTWTPSGTEIPVDVENNSGISYTLPFPTNVSEKITAIDIHTDVPNDNLESTLSKLVTFQPTSRLARIPVFGPIGTLIYYKGSDNDQRVIFPLTYVNRITFKITNNFNQSLTFGGHIQFTLLFKIMKKNLIKHNEHDMFAQMISQLSEITQLTKMSFLSKN